MQEKLLHTSIEADNAFELKAYKLLLLFVGFAYCLPIWTLRYLPLVDYPNHLARIYILHSYNGINNFQANFQRILEPIPNLAIDLITPPLLNFVSTEIAGKLFLTLTVLLFIFGCHLLGATIHRRPTWLAPICALFAYNSSFLYGFVNYQFSLGMFLVTLAVWLKCREHWNAASFTGVCLLVLASYLAHLSAYVFLGIAFSVITLHDYLLVTDNRIRGLLKAFISLLPLLPPLAAFMTFMHGSGKVGIIEWNSLQGKAINSLSLILSYYYRLDAVMILVVVAVLIAVAVCSRQVYIKREFLLVAICYALAFLLCPKTLLTSSGADARFVPVAALLLLLPLRFQISKRVGVLCLSVVIAVGLIRLSDIWWAWSKMSLRVESQVKMFDSLPPNARIYPLFFEDWVQEEKNRTPL